MFCAFFLLCYSSIQLFQIGIQASPSWIVTYFSRPSLLHPTSIMEWDFAQVSCSHQNRLVNQAETSTCPSYL